MVFLKNSKCCHEINYYDENTVLDNGQEIAKGFYYKDRSGNLVGAFQTLDKCLFEYKAYCEDA